jgi:hypothetical protein
MLERRNADFHDLSRRLLFHPHSGSQLEGGDENYYPINLSIFETDVLFWLVRIFMYSFHRWLLAYCL